MYIHVEYDYHNGLFTIDDDDKVMSRKEIMEDFISHGYKPADETELRNSDLAICYEGFLNRERIRYNGV